MIDYIPEFYKNQRQFQNSIEFYEKNEFGLALESLVELADETEHYFSEEFWTELAKSANMMEMDKVASYCKKQSKKNLKDLDYKLPLGWTTYKISENNFQVHISEKLNGEWKTERRKKDGIEKLLTKNGIHFSNKGRNGYIYYVENGKLIEFEWELEVGGIRLWFEAETHWCLPTKSELKKEDKSRIKDLITDWAEQNKEQIEFD
ncbi:hypothetical protein [Maribacter ulvicola]|uniref:Uncharacterized protein n=1 Tax=Maribacter ulvicola TaxID=228959 RepID=A0A1N6ZIR8_9FLAO|nr:hypothetical protein [Maribacter ulvicola]SIR26708.1 hypothetical protein SAMN05421797_1091 [Maribacter ulvicola]